PMSPSAWCLGVLVVKASRPTLPVLRCRRDWFCPLQVTDGLERTELSIVGLEQLLDRCPPSRNLLGSGRVAFARIGHARRSAQHADDQVALSDGKPEAARSARGDDFGKARQLALDDRLHIKGEPSLKRDPRIFPAAPTVPLRRGRVLRRTQRSADEDRVGALHRPRQAAGWARTALCQQRW